MESLAAASRRLALRVDVTVLARNPERFARLAPHLANDPTFAVVRGDVRALPADLGAFDGIVHAATPASAELNRDEPLLMLDTIVEGGRAVLDVARASGEIPVLFTSSGAVYGPQPAALAAFPETYAGAPDPLSPRNAYHEGKRVGEFQCAVYADRYGVRAKIARLFAFVGPFLPIDRHLAAGNFVRDALGGREIVVEGDGTTVRSYLYGADMTAWLWAIYVRGATGRAYNVGSERAVTIGELAHTVAARAAPAVAVSIRGVARPDVPTDRYLPDTARIRGELGVAETVSLAEGIDRTLAFHRARSA
ncbi:MAG: NAD(P)-dependent oxidoreductase [Vulcanimicrobiaceae bacterium]